MAFIDPVGHRKKARLTAKSTPASLYLYCAFSAGSKSVHQKKAGDKPAFKFAIKRNLRRAVQGTLGIDYAFELPQVDQRTFVTLAIALRLAAVFRTVHVTIRAGQVKI